MKIFFKNNQHESLYIKIIFLLVKISIIAILFFILYKFLSIPQDYKETNDRNKQLALQESYIDKNNKDTDTCTSFMKAATFYIF